MTDDTPDNDEINAIVDEACALIARRCGGDSVISFSAAVGVLMTISRDQGLADGCTVQLLGSTFDDNPRRLDA